MADNLTAASIGAIEPHPGVLEMPPADAAAATALAYASHALRSLEFTVRASVWRPRFTQDELAAAGVVIAALQRELDAERRSL